MAAVIDMEYGHGWNASEHLHGKVVIKNFVKLRTKLIDSASEEAPNAD